MKIMIAGASAIILMMVGACSQTNGPTSASPDEKRQTIGGKFNEGVEYRDLGAPSEEIPKKKGVNIVFDYSCHHCQELHQVIREEKANVSLTPAMMSQEDIAGALFFYTAREFPERFRSLHDRYYQFSQRKKIDTEDLLNILQEHEISKGEWFFRSGLPDVQAGVEKAKSISKNHRLIGTPSLIINGRYLMINGFFDSKKELLRSALDISNSLNKDSVSDH